jgi:hypothetical protein
MKLVATFTCENREANLNLRQFGFLSRTVSRATPFWYDLTTQAPETWVISRKMRLKCRCCASQLPIYSTKTSFALPRLPLSWPFQSPDMWLKVSGLNTFPVSLLAIPHPAKDRQVGFDPTSEL